ncbi:MAG: hypothetical protein B6D41_05520 [Chloroflexi bacterium UTCFX4]|jgi:Sec-independent protein secretion pathway component TatC|nr:MAG: hypothetical protein B6D41_05520 [Chloroflexi bacterium UTCFX4]
MTEIISIALLALVALLVIGPRRLPESVEALWLALTDFRRVQRGQPPLGNLYNARRYWISAKNNVYAGIQILYQVTAHLEELRRRLFYVLIAFGLGFGVAFFFAQPLLGFIIRPVRIIAPTTVTQIPINNYALAEDVQITTNVIGASGAMSQTITLPKGTLLPLGLTNTTPIVLKPTELFSVYVQIALIAGFAVALPVILFELVFFLRGPKYAVAALNAAEWHAYQKTLAPEELEEKIQERAAVYEGLTAQEMRPMYFMLPVAFVLFISGIVFTYFLLLPNALDFLFSLGGSLVQPLPSLEEYIGFALALIFWVGLAFELPLIMFFLARFNIMSARQFAQQWRYAVIIIVIAAAVITPTVDVFNMTLVALPMLGLYLLGIGFAWLARPRAAAAVKQLPANTKS